MAGDWDALFAVAADPELWALHPARDRYQEPVFRQFFDEALTSGGAPVIEDESGHVIGSSRFAAKDDAVEIGWTFIARDRWGGQVNREIRHLMVAHALKTFPRVIFRVGETNWRSRRALEKIGARLTDRIERLELNGQPVTHVIYELHREVPVA